MAIPAGTRLGPYEIVELRGKGGMGEVYVGIYEPHPFISGFANWAVHPDGRFLFLGAADPREGSGIVYIQNWQAKLESLFADEPAAEGG